MRKLAEAMNVDELIRVSAAPIGPACEDSGIVTYSKAEIDLRRAEISSALTMMRAGRFFRNPPEVDELGAMAQAWDKVLIRFEKDELMGAIGTLCAEGGWWPRLNEIADRIESLRGAIRRKEYTRLKAIEEREEERRLAEIRVREMTELGLNPEDPKDFRRWVISRMKNDGARSLFLHAIEANDDQM